VVSNSYKWILLQNKGCVSGLYYENVKSGTTITRLGVIGDSTTVRAAPLPPQYHDCGFPSPPIGRPNAGLFLSVAVLSGLERVDVCYIDKRCTGMLIHYLNGHTTVLGQWHASCVSQCSCIYNCSGPSITKIYFRMLKSGDHQIVTDISFSPDTSETTPVHDYRVFDAGEVNCKLIQIHNTSANTLVQHIAWWFSERYDTVLRWTGALRDIPQESTMRLHL
jgi:hypothetical protein